MSFRRVVVITSVCAMAWVLAANRRYSHADTPIAPVGPLLTLTLLHSNDTHSHIESFIDTIPQGGVARRKTLIEQVRGEVGADHVLLLDAGDFFQGTTFFNAWGGSESIMAMNNMRYDAATLGNHEFDLGPAGLARALKGGEVLIAGARHETEAAAFPLLATNLDISKEATLDGLLHKYRVIEKAGNQYGVLGVVTQDLPVISNLGPNIKVLDYVDSVNATTALLHSLGINKVILLSHSGYAVDMAKAASLSGVDIIVSGHDHALLGDPARIDATTADTGYAGQGNHVVGPYPSEQRDRDGNKVLLVSAYEWGRWLGRLEVRFDGNGNVISSVDKSLFVDARKVAEDPDLAAKVARYKAPIDAFANARIGRSAMLFPRDPGSAAPYSAGLRTGETVLGNLVTDLMQAAAQRSDQSVAAFTNGGGLRANIAMGEVTYGQALSVLPFGSTLFVMDLTGQEVIDLLEASVGKLGGGGFLQLSEDLRMTYCAVAEACVNPLKAGGKVTSIHIAGQPVDAAKTYRLASSNYTAAGGDGYVVLKNACKRPDNYCRDTGIVLLDLLVAELKSGIPLAARLDGRITRQ